MIQRIVIALWVSAFVAIPVCAQPQPAEFEALISAAHAQAEDLDFTALRLTWADHDDYNPYVNISDLYKETIPALAQAIAAKQYSDAVQSCRETSHLYQLDLKWNLRCKEAYDGLGDAENAQFHDYMVTGLVKSIMRSGDGEAPESAYRVITLAEEYAVFAVLDVSKAGQSLVEIDGSHYDLITVKEKKTGTERELYFNVDAIQAWLNRP